MKMNQLIDKIKQHPDCPKAGMILAHNGVVRETSRDGRHVSGLRVAVDRGKLKVANDKAPVLETELESTEGSAWHPVTVTWQKDNLQIRIGRQSLPQARIPGEMPIKQQARGLDIHGGRKRAKMALVTFGPLAGAIIDDVVMGN